MNIMNQNNESALLSNTLSWRQASLRMVSALALLLVTLASTACVSSDLESDAPPVITVDVRSEQTYVIGEDIIQIYVTATHPSGGAVDLSMSGKPERAQF